ncbi:hypothetical protein [Halosimplex pelagicum]|uniref:Uncharacterized protein n=1 Tax=Halosimplex pelagicum TaxID=869886 RepID=A0A7D5TFZ6_9EURY|nr:hypothetical protein [Halosimplex pelagicum]QLH81016.1 hypothetical protein HZS54_04910 [Halosimplex pelagicum]
MSETQTTTDEATGSRSGGWDEDTVAAAERLIEKYPDDDPLVTLCESIVQSNDSEEARS